MTTVALSLALLLCAAVFWAWRRSLLAEKERLTAALSEREDRLDALYDVIRRKNAYIRSLEQDRLADATPAELVDSLNGMFSDGGGGEAGPVPSGSGSR